MMTELPRRAAAAYYLSLGDDEMILGHRDSEWTGHAPILEEDIAFANLALDEMGHAVLWYRLHAELAGEDPETYPDRLVFRRPVEDFRHAPVVELPKGDWAFSMIRQFLFDAAEQAWLTALSAGGYAPAASVARKVLTEERYHLQHTRAWVVRLGLGRRESHARMQRALDEVWPFAIELFAPRPGEAEMSAGRFCPDGKSLRQKWLEDVEAHVAQAGLTLPRQAAPTGFTRTRHTPHLYELVAEMQSVSRLEPEGVW